MVETPLMAIGEYTPSGLSLMETEPYLKARVSPFIVPIPPEAVQLSIPPLHLTNCQCHIIEGPGALRPVSIVEGLLIRKKSIVRKILSPGGLLNLKIWQDDLENPSKKPILKLRLI